MGSATPLGTGLGAALTINSTGPTVFASTVSTGSGIIQADGAGLGFSIALDRSVRVIRSETEIQRPSAVGAGYAANAG